MGLKIHSGAAKILEILEQAGHKAYVVGGCVRNSLLGVAVKDWDITTNAKPEEVMALFSHTIPTGLKHGTVTILMDGEGFEVTTFRRDGEYFDSRRPDRVTFTNELEEDLARRDFTMNAIAYNPKEGFVDPFGGMKAIEENDIVAVGNPDDRFREDPLRMMRAIRFSAQLDMILDSKTQQAITRNAFRIVAISHERVRDELCKILESDSPVFGVSMLQLTGLLKLIIPELHDTIGFSQHNPNHIYSVFEHILMTISHVESPCLVTRLAALLHDIGKPLTFSMDDNGVGHFYGHHMVGAKMAEVILKRLKFDNDTTEVATTLVREHMSVHEHLRQASVKKFITRVGVGNLHCLFELMEADRLASTNKDVKDIYCLKKSVEDILRQKQALTILDLKINGHDLAKLGIPKNRIMGKILQQLLDEVLEEQIENTLESLITRALELDSNLRQANI